MSVCFDKIYLLILLLFNDKINKISMKVYLYFISHFPVNIKSLALHYDFNLL